MKKLLMMVAAVALAVSAQAAGCEWKWYSGTYAAYKPGTTDTVLSGVTAYLFFAADAASANTAKGDLLTSLRAGGTISGATATATLGTDGILAETKAYYGDAGTKYYAYTIILAEDAAGNTYMYQSANLGKSASDVGAVSLAFNISKTDTFGMSETGTAAGWYQTTSNVPEPASVSLLLLGLCALGLKRKNA